MRILTFTTLYPNAIQQRHGIFVENRVRQLHALGGLDCRVLAPVPWFPFSSKRFGRWAQYAAVPEREDRFGIQIEHPRYPVIPKIGMNLAPLLLAAFSWPAISRLRSGGSDFDLIDAHYYYPDGVAAAILAHYLKKPLVITARGSDINLLPHYFIPRKAILCAAGRAVRSITVCSALRDEMLRLGAEPDKILVFRNGVDLDFFKPLDRDALRKKFAITRPCLFCVGNLVELKGHHLVIQGLKSLPAYQLLIAGDGEESENLEKLAQRLGVADRVSFLGTLTQAQLVEYYSAVDVLVLASSREGLANVLLESMACGTPVVATRCGGTPEVVTCPEAGILMDERSAQAIANAVHELEKNSPRREATRKYAEHYSWENTVRGIKDTFRDVRDEQLSG